MRHLAIALLIISLPAYTDNKPPPEPPNVSIDSENSQSMAQKQTQTAISEGSKAKATGGNADATGGHATGGSVGGVTTTITNKRPHRNTPNPDAPTVYPTVPCFRGQSGSAVAPGFGISIGRGKIDEGCVRRELIRLAPETHKLFLFCNEPTVLSLFSDLQTCLDHNQPSTPPPSVQYDDTVLTQQIEAVTARTQTLEIRAKRQSLPRSDPYQAMQARVQTQTEYIE